jgi:hypothetical protein
MRSRALEGSGTATMAMLSFLVKSSLSEWVGVVTSSPKNVVLSEAKLVVAVPSRAAKRLAVKDE